MVVLLIPLQSLRCVLFAILRSESCPARFRAVLAALSFEQALAVAVLLVLNMVLVRAAMTRFKRARLMGEGCAGDGADSRRIVGQPSAVGFRELE